MAKKKFKDVEAQYNDEKYVQPLSKDNLDDEIFDALEAGVVQDDTLSIFEIIPDETQPRRVVPDVFRWQWSGKPSEYGDVLEAWEEEVLESTDGNFPTKDMLRGKTSIADYVTDDPVVIGFAKIVWIAASIHDVGLNHAIGVVKRGNFHRIVYGERRWTAYQLLQHYLGDTTDDYRNIAVKIANVGDWMLAKAQSSENNQNDPLNAIGKARQFAKLLIIARRDSGEQYDDWKALVVNCDRPWYAQVANGDLHPIPYGMGPQFEQAMNISTGQMRQYRGLLRLTDDSKVNDALWMLGDKGNWSERFLRDIGQYLDADEITRILSSTKGRSVTTVTVLDAEEALREAVEGAKKAAELAKKQAERDTPQVPPLTDKSTWESYKWVGREAWAGPQKVFVIDATKPQTVIIKYEHMKSGQIMEHEIHISALYSNAQGEEPDDADNADNQKPDKPVVKDKYGLPLMVGQTVKTRTGHLATVIDVQGKMVALESEQNKYLARLHYPETVEIVQPETITPDHSESGDDETPVFQIGDYVSVSANGKMRGTIRYIKEDKPKPYGVYLHASESTHYYGADEIALIHADDETPVEPEKSGYPDMAGKPLLWNDQPVFGVSRLDDETMLVHTGDGSRVPVAMAELSVNEDAMNTPAKDYFNQAQNSPKTTEVDAEYLLSTDDPIRPYLSKYMELAEMLGNQDAYIAIEWLLGQRFGGMSSSQTYTTLNNVYNYVEDMNQHIEEQIFERFRILNEEVSNRS